MSKSVILIGVSGPTNSGKTTVVRRLVKDVPNCYSMCQDHYFMPPGDERLAPLYIPNLDHHNWEDYRALEMDKLVEDVEKKISNLKEESLKTPAFLIVEGFSIFGWRPLCSKLEKKYFLSVSKEVCQKRRLGRNYNPPDVPGYFTQVVWPMHERHLETLREQKDIVYVDSNQSIENLYQKILTDIQTYSNGVENGFD